MPTSVAGRIPLFPLSTVLFPGGDLRLRIFEVRYLDMFRSCLKSNTDFGVVAIERGSEVGAAEFFSVGTQTKIVNWAQEPDGLFGIRVVGQRRFRILTREREDNGLYVAEIDFLPEQPAVALTQEQTWATDFLRKIGAESAGEQCDFTDANWVAWRLAEILPTSLTDKQALLELEDVDSRLASLRQHSS